MFGAVFAAMSMQWTVASAVGAGVFKERLPFLRTAKGGATRKGDFPAFWEGVIAALLLIGALTLGRHQFQASARNQYLRGCSCGAEPAVPFGGGLALIEGTRLNSFAYWRALEAKALEFLPRSKAIAEPAKLPAENRVEAAQ